MQGPLETIARALRQSPQASEPKIRMRIESTTHNYNLGGVVVLFGVGEYDVPASEAATIDDLVEDAALVAEAKKRLARFEQALARKERGEPVADTALPRYPLSLSAVFTELHSRGMRPFVSAQRVDVQTTQTSKPAKG